LRRAGAAGRILRYAPSCTVCRRRPPSRPGQRSRGRAGRLAPLGSPSARVTATAALALLAALPLLAGCGDLGKIGAGAHNPPAANFTVADRVTAVVIDGGSGSIDVTGSSRSTVSVSQHATYTDKPPAAAHVLRGTTLTLSYTCPAELVCGVSYNVQVPAGVAVTLTSLSGTVTAHAGAGLITAVDLRSPVASFNSSAGGVVATFSSAPRSVTADTKLGPITLTVPGSVAYQLNTHTVVGTSTITVRRSTSSAHTITASSDLGSISVSPS
jgi:hypothetical protein